MLLLKNSHALKWRRLTYASALLISIILLFIVLCRNILLTPATEIVLINSGQTELTNISLHVSGETYSVAALAPGESKSIKLYPKFDSHVEIEFKSADDLTCRIPLHGYVAPNIHANFIITLDSTGINSQQFTYR